MQVPNVLSAISDLVSKPKTDVKPAAVADAALSAGAAVVTGPAAMREIVSQYDMTDITPNQFSNMIQQLRAKGAISQQDLQELSTIRIDLETAGIGPDETVNLQEFYQQRLASAQGDAAGQSDPAAAQANVQSLASRLTWIQKFAAVRSGDGAAGLNAVA
jgi:hypothetical protein